MQSIIKLICFLELAFLVSAADKDVLQDFFNSTNGENWKHNFNWNSENSICTWFGVLCSSDGQSVIDLQLESNNLKGNIPESFGSLSQLVTVSLGVNNLTGSLPSSIGMLRNLQSLDFSANQLTGSIPTSIGKLKELQELDLSANQLSGLIPNSISKLRKVEILLLENNHLSGMIPETIGSLKNLNILSLSNNFLNGTIPASLQSIVPQLNSCDLSRNEFTCPVPSWASPCSATCIDR